VVCDMSGQTVTVSVTMQRSLYEKIQKRIAMTSFQSVADYIVYVLDQVVSDEEEEKEVYSKEDEEKIKERLRRLGYL